MFDSDVNVALSTNFSLGPDSLLRDEQMACAVECQAALLLGRHPKALGRPARENWAELWGGLKLRITVPLGRLSI